MGRALKRTPAAADIIVKVLELGNTRTAAFNSAGMKHTVFEQWMREDPEFRARVEAAEQVAFKKHVETIRLASQPRTVRTTTTKTLKNGDEETTVQEYTEIGDWRASAFFLARRDRENWSERYEVKTEHSGKIETGHSFDLAKLDKKKLEMLMELAEEAGATDEK